MRQLGPLVSIILAIPTSCARDHRDSSTQRLAVTTPDCDSSIDSGAGVDGTLVLAAHTFWDTSRLGPYATAVAALTASMPASLKTSSGLDAVQRAMQLRWAVYVANNVTPRPPATRVIVPSCEYDFSTWTEPPADPSAPPVDASPLYRPFLPRLFVRTSNISIEGDPAFPAPVLFYAGPGLDGLHHGRVLVMVPSALTGILIQRLALRGDHDPSSWATAGDVPFYVHENNEELRYAAGDGVDRRFWHGMLMVGLGGGANGVTIDNVQIDQISRAGIALIGNATITNCAITGIAPIAYPNMVDDLAINIPAAIRAGLGTAPPSIGLGYLTAIAQSYDYGPMVVQNNTIQNVVEGVNGDATSWNISNNSFRTIGDHGIYLLRRAVKAGSPIAQHPTIQHSTFDGNTFEMGLGPAINIGGQSCDETIVHAPPAPDTVSADCVSPTDPLDPGDRAGAFASSISNNTFHLIWQSALLVSGTFNTISGNSILPYATSDDPTYPYSAGDPRYRWPLDPSIGGLYSKRNHYIVSPGCPGCPPAGMAVPDISPDFWFGTSGGQGVTPPPGSMPPDLTNVFSNHNAFNRILDNSRGADPTDPLSIFFTQPAGERDMSISFNYVQGTNTTVYFKTRANSRHAPMISLGGDPALVVGGPPDCPDCNGWPGTWPQYRDTIDATWVQPIAYRDAGGARIPHVLARYGSAPDLFLIGENGVHQRLAPDGTVATFLANADLDGDGIDELYYRLGGETTVRGSTIYARPGSRAVADLTGSGRWIYSGRTVLPVAAAPFARAIGAPPLLALAFAGDDNIYGSTMVGGVPVLGPPIYTGNAPPLFPSGSTARLMRGADTSAAGEAGGNIGEELYVSFGDGAVAGIYWDFVAGNWRRQSVYSGTQILSIMSPGRLRAGEAKQRMYQRYEGPTIYENVPSPAGSLPAFGSGSAYYSGADDCDMLVAGAFDQSGLDRMAAHFRGDPARIYWGGETSPGTTQPDVGTLYDGTVTPTVLVRAIDARGHDRLLSIFGGIRTIYLSELLAANGYDYADWIRSEVWTSLGL